MGESFFDVLRAELAVLRADLRTSARFLKRSALLLVLALFTCFWALGTAVYLLVALLSLWLPGWGAAAVVLALLLLLTFGLLMAARNRLRQIEPPAQTLQRRVDEHKDWWHENLLPEAAAGGEALAGDVESTPDLPDGAQ
jgi:hypothetical protein